MASLAIVLANLAISDSSPHRLHLEPQCCCSDWYGCCLDAPSGIWQCRFWSRLSLPSFGWIPIWEPSPVSGWESALALLSSPVNEVRHIFYGRWSMGGENSANAFGALNMVSSAILVVYGHLRSHLINLRPSLSNILLIARQFLQFYK